ncbi:MAG: NUDIX domain-containing protein [Elusimicrobia bacterium]|nr:NUDIX domain-containing protein [Elusimicrobiota bacterium]
MKEFSAGGVVMKDKKLLLIRVKNLSGRIVWTFPKGHIEKGESVKTTALREVREETGFICRIVKPLGDTRYSFKRGNKFVNKKVVWFLMVPLKKIAEHDFEVLKTMWVGADIVKKYLKYPSDLKLISKLGETGQR